MDLTGAAWRRASSSDDADEASVEIAFVAGSKEGSEQVIAMRDSRQPDGPVLIFTPDEWRAFTAGVQDGEFERCDSEDVADRTLALLDGFGVRTLIGDSTIPLERARSAVARALARDLGVGERLVPFGGEAAVVRGGQLAAGG